MLLRRLPSEPPSPDPAGDSPAPLRSKLRSLLWPLGLQTEGLEGIILVLLVFAAREQDQLALEASEHLARSALQNEINEIKSEARDYATWDATLDNLVLTLNESWADENIGTWAHDGLEMDATLVVDGQDRARYAMIAGERLGDEALTRITDGLAPLVGAARAAPPSDLGIALSGHLVLDGQIAIAAASPIVRTDGTVATKPDGASVLVYIRTLDAAALKEMEENYL
ncbi:MAG: CHASE4 domain-containing protein [Kiloniellaceae bacterium]